MKNLELFKNSIVYAFNSTTDYFFRLLGYLLVVVCGLILSGGFVTAALMFISKFASLPGPLAGALGIFYLCVMFYTVLSGVAIFQRNLIDLYDEKPFRGFSEIIPSASFVLTTAFVLLIALLKIPGHYAFSLLFDSPSSRLMFFYAPVGSLFLKQYQWFFYGLFFIGTYLSARLDSAYYIALDSGKGVMASIKESWKLTKGRAIVFFSFYFITYIVGIALTLVSPLLNMIFSVLVTPTYIMFYICLYRRLSKGE